MNLTPENLYDQWVKIMSDSMKVPQSPEQVRREWYKTLKTDELWEVHDEVIRELKSR
jgi:hypothetical protein